MPLKLRLKPNEKIIVNGAVIVCEHGGTELTFLNQARILREDDVVSPEALEGIGTRGGTRSGARQLYFIIQLLYIDPEKAEQYLPLLAQSVAAVRDEYPDRGTAIDGIVHLLADGFLYRALKACRETFPDCVPGHQPPESAAPQSNAKTHEDDMPNGYTGGYDQPPSIDDPRALEAWALTKASQELEACIRHPEDVHRMRDALRKNQMLWTIFQSAVSERQTPLSDELRDNILALSYAIDRKTFSALGDHNVDTIRFLIGINRNVAMGLLGSGEGGAATRNDRVDAAPAPQAPAESGRFVSA